MNKRLNQIMQQNEQLEQKKRKEKQKKATTIPVYDMSGKTITPEKKRREFRLAVVLLIFAGLFAFLYLPGFFMKDNVSKVEEAAKIKVDSTAIRKSNTALRNHPEEDFDGDGLTNAEETAKNTDPWKIDTDGDAISDYCEINVTNTDPNHAESIMVDAQTKSDKTNGKNVGSPYKIGNVILWADDYTSKAYGSVVETLNGYHFSMFDGYAQFPEKDGKYAYKVKNGIREMLPYREAENVWKVSAGDVVEVYEEPLEEIVEFRFFSHPVYAPSNTATDVLAKILPDKGFITAMKKMKMDVEPDTRDNTFTDIVKPTFDSADEYRFTINSNTLNDLLFVRDSIKEDDCCIAVSLYNQEKGEYLAIAYGYTYDGDLLLADMDTLEPIGTLNIIESARKSMNENGDIVSISYFDFEGFGFSSLNGDRISFFAASAQNSATESQFGQKEETEESDTTQEPESEASPTEPAQTKETEETEETTSPTTTENTDTENTDTENSEEDGTMQNTEAFQENNMEEPASSEATE